MLTRSDLAKYPFLTEATDYVRELGFSIKDIEAPEFGPVLDRAEKRLEEALSKGRVSTDTANESAEILSFPISNLILSLIGEERADRKSTRLNSSHVEISYAVFCLKKKR